MVTPDKEIKLLCSDAKRPLYKMTSN
jgi:hypothetical protein